MKCFYCTNCFYASLLCLIVCAEVDLALLPLFSRSSPFPVCFGCSFSSDSSPLVASRAIMDAARMLFSSVGGESMMLSATPSFENCDGCGGF
jgi:hypothetical protein